MKDKGISRNIGAGSRRASGETGPGQFQRAGIPQSAPQNIPPRQEGVPVESPKGERRRRKVIDDGRYYNQLDNQRMKSAMMLWTMLLGFVGIVVVILFVVFWFRPYIERRDRMAATSPEVDKFVPIEEAIQTVRPGETESLAMVKQALEARTVNEVLESIDPGNERVERVVTFLEQLEATDGKISSYKWTSRLDTNREDISGVVVTFGEGDAQKNRIALLTQDTDGKWKVDFPAFARLASPSWEDLISGKADVAVVRIYLAKDQYFNGPFQEKDGWQCYGVASPDVPELMFGYCQSGSDQDRAIKSFLGFRKMGRATVALEREEGADKRQFKIKRLLAEDWVVGEMAADQSVPSADSSPIK